MLHGHLALPCSGLPSWLERAGRLVSHQHHLYEMRKIFARRQSLARIRSTAARQRAKREGASSPWTFIMQRRGQVFLIGSSTTKSGVVHTPQLNAAYFVRRKLRPLDKDSTPGVCKVYNADGTLREILDPFTRQPIAPPLGGRIIADSESAVK